MNPNQALWEKGDFTKIAAFMRQSGEEVVASLGINPPVRVLDLAAETAPRRFPLPATAPMLSASIFPRTWWTPGSDGLRKKALSD